MCILYTAAEYVVAAVKTDVANLYERIMGQYNILLCDIHFYVASLYCFVYIPITLILLQFILLDGLPKNREQNRFTRTTYRYVTIIICV